MVWTTVRWSLRVARGRHHGKPTPGEGGRRCTGAEGSEGGLAGRGRPRQRGLTGEPPFSCLLSSPAPGLPRLLAPPQPLSCAVRVIDPITLTGTTAARLVVPGYRCPTAIQEARHGAGCGRAGPMRH